MHSGLQTPRACTSAPLGPVDALNVFLCSIDGHPLLIKQLKGDKPAESIDLSNKKLNVASAVVIASLIGSNSETVTKSLNLASNQLVLGGEETGYVKKSKVQGESFEIGAKVMYQGRKMIVTMAPDSDGYIKMKPLDLSGILALAEAVKANKTLQSIK
eukprot:172599-Prymnesium_polylepis.1